MIVRNDFGVILDNKLKNKNISKAQLARLIDVSDTTVSRYVLGYTRKPKKLLLERIAKVLGCSIREFLK